MKHRLSIAYFTLLTENIDEVTIDEVTIDEGIEWSLEMIEECYVQGRRVSRSHGRS
ncbi:hypothetical protein H4J58_02700 [Colwellia sp. MB3u-70]|uniref:hypothetical protein n=1 Tax=unclassified Colwellia TaxID=196834 RepID=UPI0015F672EA|nr:MULTISPECIES: hypothetical protein [unclassified Colwellia]MBA6293560.1 hypothetical protein [Colwellia sp. MB3u-8]MBA6306040.1 hypothetical protein [Colwellia sp. MB3u-70]